ncbi:MAG: T9SS type A sorting domain-containing protein, partial [Saprospiraceae bacterium]|nr:T9SS type A sorting domain-containing protein [Saprospiraceae bacterium]
NVNGNGFAGVEVRNSLDPNSKKIAIGTNKVNRIIRMARVIEGYPAWPQEVFSLDKFWVKIERSGSYFRALASTDDINYIPYLFQAIPMEECTKVGLFVHSKVPGAIVTADFTNVEIGQAVPLIEDPSKNGTVMSTPMSAQINVGLSPNPAKDELRIDLHSLIAQDVSIRIYNINGQLMTNRQIDYVENATEIIAIDRFPAGTYYVHVKTAQQQQTLKLVKQ